MSANNETSSSRDAEEALVESSEVRRLGEEAAAAAESLRSECERGLRRCRYLMAYMAIVSAAVAPVIGVLEWVLVESRRGSLERDWWKCMIHSNVVTHWVNSNQEQLLPEVLAALLTQAVLLAWASIIVYQRACIRMDWISSCIINGSYTLLLILLPPFQAAFPVADAVSASLVSLTVYLDRPDLFANVPEPNKCARAHAFCRVCIGMGWLCAATNLACVLVVIRAESIRRRAVAAEKKLLSNTCRESRPSFSDKSSLADNGLAHRLCCTDGAPREIVFGGAMVVSYVVCASCRAAIQITSQRAFDHLARQRSVSTTTNSGETAKISGGTVLVGTAPDIALGSTFAFLSFASILRGFSSDDLANYRIAALLGMAALYVDLPAITAHIHISIQDHFYDFDVSRCVRGFIRDRAENIYGFPSPGQSRTICRCISINLYSACLHVLAVACMAGSAIRTFTLNNRPFDNVVTPAPDDQGSMRLLQTADDSTFEYDLTAPPLRHSALPPRGGSYSAVFIRPPPLSRSESAPDFLHSAANNPRRARIPPNPPSLLSPSANTT